MKEKKATAKSAVKSTKNAKKNDGIKTDESQQYHEEKPFDFGGIPDRNLKKNLGCG